MKEKNGEHSNAMSFACSLSSITLIDSLHCSQKSTSWDTCQLLSEKRGKEMWKKWRQS